MRKSLMLGAFLLAGGLAACEPYPNYGPGPYPEHPGYPGQPGYGHTPRPGEGVETVGCPRPGVENRCTVLQGADGRSWNVAGSNIPAYSDWAVRVSGRAAISAVGYCQEGMLLTEARWEYTNLRCVGGAVQGHPGGYGGYPPPPPAPYPPRY